MINLDCTFHGNGRNTFISHIKNKNNFTSKFTSDNSLRNNFLTRSFNRYNGMSTVSNFYSDFSEEAYDRYQEYQINNEVGSSLSKEVTRDTVDIILNSKNNRELSRVSISLPEIPAGDIMYKDDIYYSHYSLVIEK